jgi:phosphoribosylformimino-5-aminoimidazole carboxamide ribotide isomerase
MSAFTIYPAIDLRQGRVVRLRQGDPSQEKQYSDDPASTARSWLEAGAAWLHVVNLDGAFAEKDQANSAALKGILNETERFGRAVQFGGGLRSLEQIERVFAAGIQRAVLGTAALDNPGFTAEAISRFGRERLAIALDVRNGRLQSHGWLSDSGKDALKVSQELASLGIKTIIHTNISRDGTGSGVDLAASQALAKATGLKVIASGGVNSLEEVRQARQAGLEGIIIGRALYEGIFRLEEALRC